MRRIFVDPEFLNGSALELTGDSFHHAVSVLRMKKGEKFDALLGDGYLYSCEILNLEKKSAQARVLDKIKLPTLPSPDIHLAVSLPRLSTFEWIVEKSVELGVKSIQPLTSEFSFIKKASELSDSKLERLNKIIRSATEQSRRGDLMTLEPVISLDEWVKGLWGAQAPNAQKVSRPPCIFAYEGSEGCESIPLRRALEAQAAGGNPRPSAIWALCGSEGGFSLKEVQLLQSFNHFPVSMGHQILRAETACLALVSVIKYAFDHMGDGNERAR